MLNECLWSYNTILFSNARHVSNSMFRSLLFQSLILEYLVWMALKRFNVFFFFSSLFVRIFFSLTNVTFDFFFFDTWPFLIMKFFEMKQQIGNENDVSLTLHSSQRCSHKDSHFSCLNSLLSEENTK